MQTVQAPHVGQSPLFYRFLWTPPLKVKYFSERPKCFSFSSLTSSYCWKGTKFFVKISWFISLVMTEKNIFLYKLFLWLSISDSSLFFCKNFTPPSFLKKVSLSFPAIPLSKLRPVKPSPFWTCGRRFNPPQLKGGWGAHYFLLFLTVPLMVLLRFQSSLYWLTNCPYLCPLSKVHQ